MGSCASDEEVLPPPHLKVGPPPQANKHEFQQIPIPDQITQQLLANENRNDPTMLDESIIRANQLFKNGQYSSAIIIYKRYIQEHIAKENRQIDGLGNSEQALSYYEWFLYRWYSEGIKNGIYRGTAYDALSLCYLSLKSNEDAMEDAMKWYQSMIDLYPDRHQLLYGYANILYSKGIYEEAVDYYNRVITMRPEWKMPYECIAFVYQYKRIEKPKAIELAKKLLTLQPNNRIGMFVLARNEKNTETKIEKLKEVMAVHPLYARVINQIGIVYGGTKKEYRQAITWYTKCTELTPQYASCYNNIGVNYELMKEYEQAIKWYFKGIQKDKQYKAPHKNLSDVFDTLKLSEQQIKEHMAKYKIFPDYFFYYLGLSYYDKKDNGKSLRYFQKSQQCAQLLSKQIHKLYNSMGITYDEMRDYQNAKFYYKKCIQKNKKYHSAYYNLAIVYKNEKNIPQAKNWYNKAIQANPRYSYAYNNLGNIYKNQQNYQQAIKNYKNAVKHLSTYTLAYANLGICYLKLQNFRDAFNAMSRATEMLPTDNNNLSEGNKSFLKETLQQFQREGQAWRMNGGISTSQRSKLQGLIKSFESNFKILFNEKQKVNLSKMFKKQIIQILHLNYSDKFQLNNIDKIYDLVKIAFQSNQEYFHIIPQFFLQYFIDNAFVKSRPVLEIQKELFQIIKRLSIRTMQEGKNKNSNSLSVDKTYQFKLEHFTPPSECQINLFKQRVFFNDYAQIYGQIMHINQQAKKSYKQFKEMVDQVRKQSYGIPYGVGTKLPIQQKDQFKVILRIFEKMFKKQMNIQRVQSIINKIESALIKKRQLSGANANKISVGEVVRDIMIVWTNEITQIVKERKAKDIQTKCQISDLLRGKIMFVSVDRIKKALTVLDSICYAKGYKIIEMENRLAKPQTRDVVLKIQVNKAVCELQLAMEQEQTQYHFIHSIYELERSPLGCIFGSYIFMAKGFKYHILQNCKDIVEQLKNEKSNDLKTLDAAQYVIDTIGQS